MSNFNERFKELRLKNNLTQADLANEMNLSRSAISMYENGNREPDFETLEIIADYFNVDMNYLVGKEIIEDKAEIIRRMISEKWGTLKEFAEKCLLPVETFYHLFKKGIDDVDAADIEVICENLGIDWDDLDRISYGMSPKEKMDEEITTIAKSISQNDKLKRLYKLCEGLNPGDIDLLIDMAERMY